MSLRLEQLRWRAGGRLVVDGVSLDVPTGATLGLVGPNGSGKSSLLRLVAGLRRPSSGIVALDGDTTRRALSRRLALVEQQAATDVPLTVEDVVRLGRTPHRGPFSAWSAADEAAVERALALCDMGARRLQRWHTLSGGERQRCQIARALAQEPSELLLDEPTNHLDIRHQLEILHLVRRLPLTAVIALHDLNLAARFCDLLAVMAGGRLVAAGPPASVLTAGLIRRVFDVSAEIGRHGPDLAISFRLDS